MKNFTWKYESEKKKQKQFNKEYKAGGFTCSHCKQFVFITDVMGTQHRNHCNYCLWSKHVDLIKPGDRKATCHNGMKPIGLTFKNEGYDKYGRARRGELKLIHLCAMCEQISTNRTAADDITDEIFAVLSQSLSLDEALKIRLEEEDIAVLNLTHKAEIEMQLFGR